MPYYAEAKITAVRELPALTVATTAGETVSTSGVIQRTAIGQVLAVR